MLTIDKARALVIAELDRFNVGLSGPEVFVVLDEHTDERPWGWIFYYTTRGFRDGDNRYAVAGNGPFIVNRHTGEMQALLTAMPINRQIAEYEARITITD